MEEIYENKIQKYLTYFIDNLFNLEFGGNQHTNRTDMEWKSLFQILGLVVKKSTYEKRLFVLSQVIYHLEKLNNVDKNPLS